MYKHILLMRNGCTDCNINPCVGVLLAKSLEAKVTGVYVTENLSAKEILDIYNPTPLKWAGEGNRKKEAMAEAETRRKEVATNSIKKSEMSCANIGVPFESVYLTGESPVDAVLKVAADRHCDLIVTSTHPRGLKDLLFDALDAKKLGKLKIPVLCHHCG
jgi:nucleotide-binding universal stress UspA family protein